MSGVKQIIAELELATQHGVPHYHFEVGPWTGYPGPSVVRALERRGYRVDRLPSGGGYIVYAKAPTVPTETDFLAALGPCNK